MRGEMLEVSQRVLFMPTRLVRKIITYYKLSKVKEWSGDGWAAASVQLTNPMCITIGKRAIIHSRVWLACLSNAGEINLGDDVHISRDVIIASAIGISLGNGVTIGPRACLYDNNHAYADKLKSVMQQGVEAKPIMVGDFAWIGAHAIILPGVKIGESAIVGAGAIVTKNVPDCAIVAGNPARIIGHRKYIEK